MDVEKLKAIVELLSGSDVTSLDWKSGEESLILRRGVVQSMGAPSAPLAVAQPTPPVQAAGAAIAAPEGRKLHTVTSPFVGTFYRTASPESPAFAEIGQSVRKGQVLCIVEAMKLMNEIEAEIAGRVTEILAQNGQAVEFGEPLFRLEPAGA